MSRIETIGAATLYLGDCREILPTLGKVDAFISDPPYEIRNKFGTTTLDGFRRMEFDFDVAGVTEDVVLPAFRAALKISKSFHCFCGLEQYGLLAGIARECGFTPKPWAKEKLVPPPPMPGNWWPSAFEVACYGYTPGAFFGDESNRRKNLMRFDSYRNGIRADEKVNHPTQKWLPMMDYLVQSIVPMSGVALDAFMGSGTTGVACARLGRKFIGIELEERYFSIACRRIEQAQRQSDLFIAPPPKAAQAAML